ncbi:hypothetical protein [Flavobacterium suncheonense]|uniref:Uncharacterized protein n=1 Tax=Flavobacterium suncheonense GH29-5 = DSM 17707 TaxID=1121899 RepID=A0A0A2MMP7_9FLAO|nr:hypothetical protein [Flavobacterium suncheonense]KGO89560.1 hypothetical protein Q764_07255 [Flavobacterium suncheonense GH29-5 = DSM 17707]
MEEFVEEKLNSLKSELKEIQISFRNNPKRFSVLSYTVKTHYLEKEIIKLEELLQEYNSYKEQKPR